jgi:alpha-L-fucosidase
MMNQSRRDFLKKTGLLTLGSTVLPGFNFPHRSPKVSQDQPEAEPTPVQKRWMDMKFGMFIHFGINTYYDKEWSDGTLDPSRYNPTQLDTDQWCRVAKNAGMKYIVFVTKHHDGFCNWKTELTDYSVKSTPYKGDVVEELVKSAQKYGLKVGFYYSLWDRHEKLYETDEYRYVLEFMKPQLKELLTRYGEVCELWFDGFWKKQQSGWKDDQGNRPSGEEFIQSWRMEGAYHWQMDHIYQYVKELQPDCLVMNNATSVFAGVPLHPVDILSGERATEEGDYKRVWQWLGEKKYFPMQIETTMSAQGNERFPSGNWFWHESDHSVLSPAQVRELLDIAGKKVANLLLNCGPMASGKLRPEDVRVLNQING